MDEISRVGSLEINQDLEFERRQWAIQRIGWILLILVLGATLLGVFGSGPLSHSSTSAGALTLNYERLVRERAPTALRVQLAPEAVADGEAVLWLNRPFLNRIQIQQFMPQPVEMATDADRIRFHILVANTEQPGEITIEFEPSQPGLMDGRLGLDGGPDLAFTQFVFP